MPNFSIVLTSFLGFTARSSRQQMNQVLTGAVYDVTSKLDGELQAILNHYQPLSTTLTYYISTEYHVCIWSITLFEVHYIYTHLLQTLAEADVWTIQYFSLKWHSTKRTESHIGLPSHVDSGTSRQLGGWYWKAWTNDCKLPCVRWCMANMKGHSI